MRCGGFEIPVTGRVVETAEVKMMAGGTVGELISSRKSEKMHDCADETEAVIL